MNAHDLNKRLWTIAKWGLPTVLVFLAVALVFKLRIVFAITDIIGLLLSGVIILALTSDWLVYSANKDISSKAEPINNVDPTFTQVKQKQ